MVVVMVVYMCGYALCPMSLEVKTVKLSITYLLNKLANIPIINFRENSISPKVHWRMKIFGLSTKNCTILFWESLYGLL